MIVTNHQQNILYYKQYPCYSLTTHLSEHRQLQFANVTYIQFTNQTSPKRDLPKYFVDKYQAPHKMYWMEWRVEELAPAVIQQGRTRINKLFVDNQSLNNNQSPQTLKKKHYRCLYMAEVGRTAHIKLVFNSDPELVGICQDFIYTIGGNQLIITELWPQNNIQFMNNIDYTKQLPSKQSQIVHKLDQYSKVLALDFVNDNQDQNIVCSKIIYFSEKKGIYCQTYKKDQQSQSSLLNKIYDFSLKFKKNQPQPLYYETLVPNILGLVINTSKQIILYNLTDMKPILHTRTLLQGWQLNQHQPIIVKSRQNDTHNNFNDCLSISIGQGPNIQIFLFHIKYRLQATLYLPKQGNTKSVSELQSWPIHMFQSGEFIDWQNCVLKHLTIIHLQKVTYLTNFILSKSGLVYLGYEKNYSLQQTSSSSTQQLPLSGYINYNTPYITHEILTHENKIWRQYKLDILMGMMSQQDNKDKYQLLLQRLLTPGRYDVSFILKTLKLDRITDLNQLILSRELTIKQINQRLLYSWRNQYKFVQFVTYRGEFLIIRKNSISTLLQITFQQYIAQKDKNSSTQISYNKLISRGFDNRFDIQGDQYIQQQQNGYNIHESIVQQLSGVRGYEEKMKSISGKVKDLMAEKQQGGDNSQQRGLFVGKYYDEEQYDRCSAVYERTIKKILQLAKQATVINPSLLLQQGSAYVQQQQYLISNNNNNIQQSPMLATSQQKHILLHSSILGLKIKDELMYLIQTLKINYQYYFQGLLRQRREQRRVIERNVMEKKQSVETIKITITRDLLQRVHYQHIYTTHILQWLHSIYTKTHLQQQYLYFNSDLIQQFINHYTQKYCHGSYIQQDGTVLTTQCKLFKSDIDLHVRNVLSLMFRGLVRGVDCSESVGIVEQVREVKEMVCQQIVGDRINTINKESNPFIMMLLKRHYQIKHFNLFIINGILSPLFKTILLQSFNQNISALIPITKTFIYTILSLTTISREQKMSILQKHMHKPQYLALLLLIQLQNNCYLLIEQGLQVEIYDNDVGVFVENTVRLTKQGCCILQEVILVNYKLFLFMDNTYSTKNNKQSPPLSASIKMLNQQLHNDASDPQLQQHHKSLNEQISIEFIKHLFSNIDFMYLTYVITRPYVSGYRRQQQQQQQHQQMMLQEQQHRHNNLSVSSHYQSKSQAYIYRQLIQQVEKINQNYGPNKGTPIQRTFKKFFNKIYHPKSSQNNIYQKKPISQIYPEVTGLGYNLTEKQLVVIERLYQKHLRLLKIDKKQSFQSISIIQQRLNLEYSMIKIYLFRLNLALKEISTLVQSQQLKYVAIMRKCVQGLKQSVKSFKHWRCKLQGQKRQMSDSQFLDVIIQTERMQNSLMWDVVMRENIDNIDLLSNCYTMDSENRDVDKWLIMDIPLSEQWLQLLQLTFTQSSPLLLSYDGQQTVTNNNKPNNRSTIFTNYHSLECILMKMLIVIKKQRLQRQFQSLNKLFGQQKMQQVIRGNQMLKNLYGENNGEEGDFYNNKYLSDQGYKMRNVVGLFTRNTDGGYDRINYRSNNNVHLERNTYN